MCLDKAGDDLQATSKCNDFECQHLHLHLHLSEWEDFLGISALIQILVTDKASSWLAVLELTN